MKHIYKVFTIIIAVATIIVISSCNKNDEVYDAKRNNAAEPIAPPSFNLSAEEIDYTVEHIAGFLDFAMEHLYNEMYDGTREFDDESSREIIDYILDLSQSYPFESFSIDITNPELLEPEIYRNIREIVENNDISESFRIIFEMYGNSLFDNNYVIEYYQLIFDAAQSALYMSNSFEEYNELYDHMVDNIIVSARGDDFNYLAIKVFAEFYKSSTNASLLYLMRIDQSKGKFWDGIKNAWNATVNFIKVVICTIGGAIIGGIIGTVTGGIPGFFTGLVVGGGAGFGLGMGLIRW